MQRDLPTDSNRGNENLGMGSIDTKTGMRAVSTKMQTPHQAVTEKKQSMTKHTNSSMPE
jgi:hypothetical protein